MRQPSGVSKTAISGANDRLALYFFSAANASASRFSSSTVAACV
jgi:hypothetical protein